MRNWKLRLSRTTLLFILANEIRGLAIMTPALIAALKAHHLI